MLLYSLCLTLRWDVLQVQTNPEGQTDEEQASCAGEAEGTLTVDAIYNYYYNNMRQYCKGRKKICRRVSAFLKEHLDWVEETVKNNATDSAIWYHVSSRLQLNILNCVIYVTKT